MPTPDVRLSDFDRGTNARIVDLPGIRIAFSYATPIAVWAPGRGWVARENEWGPTTGRHIAALVGPRGSDRVPAAEFHALLLAALVLAGKAAEDQLGVSA